MSNVVSTSKLNDHYIAYEIEVPDIAARVLPGQLIEIGVGTDPVTPYAVADFSRDKGTVTVVVRNPENGDAAEELRIDSGALVGQARQTGSFHKILCVAEGLGVAGLRPRIEELKARGVYTVVVAGYATKEHIYWADRLDSAADELYIVTVDGSYGIKGPVRETVKAICETERDIERALVIGSLPLLRACCRVTEKQGIPTMISVNAVLTEDTSEPPEGTARVTSFDWNTASDLDGHKVDFDDLTRRFGITARR